VLTSHTSAQKGCPPAPTTSRVPSDRTPLALNAQAPSVTGSWRMPLVSDQKNAVPAPFVSVLDPTPPAPH